MNKDLTPRDSRSAQEILADLDDTHAVTLLEIAKLMEGDQQLVLNITDALSKKMEGLKTNGKPSIEAKEAAEKVRQIAVKLVTLSFKRLK